MPGLLPDLSRSGGFIGMAGMATTAFMYLYTPVLAPWWVFVPLMLLWLVAFVLACRWFVKRPVAAFWLPVGLLVLWFGVVVGGAAADVWA